jgi:alpha-methylacyl-CoA racemase
MSRSPASGPLKGLRVLEFAGLGPGPFCGMLLADLGADVVRIDRKDGGARAPQGLIERGRRSAALDLKAPEAIGACLELIERADALIEGFRPGVMERLGLGPDAALKRNPRLVYGRMTGWGQDGPLAQAAGHDLNYIALTGALAAIGPAERACPPLNLVGDFGGGALYLALGLLAGVLHARETGEGQVVDAAVVDGAHSLMTLFHSLRAQGLWREARESNLLDGGAHFYAVYDCADGRQISLAPLEPKFYGEFLERAGIDDPELRSQSPADWARLKPKLAEIFRSRSRDEWCALLEGTDACVAPVLTLSEAPAHSHNRARGAFVEAAGVAQPAPAPRFSATPGAIQGPPPEPGQDTEAALLDWGLGQDDLAVLRDAQAI